MSDMSAAKPYCIAKRTVWEAWQQVKANRGSAGIDDQSIADFEQNLSGNLYKLWNRMSSGSYFPPPVKQVEIPKATGGVRKLGVPTVADRIAQTVVKLLIEPVLEPIFHQDSYGYRPGRSAKQALAITRRRCWRYDWVVEFDIKAAFDRIDHGLLEKAVRKHIKEDWMVLYIGRWLRAPLETEQGTRLTRDRGAPQGGVISPLLMNLFMHYAFDSWTQREYAQCPFARYADDAVVHCQSEGQAQEVMRSIAQRLAECGLEMHPQKSKIVYCKDSNRRGAYENVSLTFLGFTFRPRSAKNYKGQGFTNFLPAVSEAALKRMRGAVKSWGLTRQTSASLADLAQQCNAVVRGWVNYYAAFYPSALRDLWRYMDHKLERWARRKYKTLQGRKTCSGQWLAKVKNSCAGLFEHWRMMGKGWMMGAV
jgi:group II intron reverse transcriptase/maturase